MGMYKVTPNILPITDLTYQPLGEITIFTLWNKGTTNVIYGFGDVTEELKPGQTVTFEAGANSVFTSSSKLVVDFKKVGSSDVNLCSMQFNRLTDASRAVANIIEK